MSTPNHPIEILLVEDNEADAELTALALRKGKIIHNLNIVTDGVEALEYLRMQAAFTSAVRPDMILLDLNLPRMSGRETLAEIKGDPELADIPIVVLTSSDRDRDVLESYRLHANCYIQKPVGLEEFIKIVQSIESFWFNVVVLPRR